MAVGTFAGVAHGMNLGLLKLPGRERLPLILQAEVAECGIACVAMVAGFHGYPIDLASLRRRFQVSLKGMTLNGLMDVAGQLGLTCRAVRLDPEELCQLQAPAILHWNLTHFVVLRKIHRKGLVVHDPALGERRVSWSEVDTGFTGVALELWPGQNFEPEHLKQRMALRHFWTRISGLKRNLGYLLALSLLLQVLVLAGPFYLQLVVDRALVSADRNLLLILAFGFALLMVLQVLVSSLRSWLLLFFTSLMSYQMVSNLFNHLLRLPLIWFQKRHVGDVVSRFSSLEHIRHLFTDGLVAVLVDGIMAVTTACMMFLYSPLLGFLVLTAVCLYGVVRLAIFPALRRRSQEQIAAQAREQSHFMESVRGIQCVRSFGRETLRHTSWLQHQAAVVNSNIALGKLDILSQGMSFLIFSSENLLVIYFAAGMILDGRFSIGMLYAFLAYKSQFSGRLSAVLDKLIDIRMLGLHLDRLSDIGLTQQEPVDSVTERRLKGSIELRSVAFRYAASEPLLFEDIDLSLSPGEFVTIVGASGTGKTSLLKVIMGLLPASQGDVRVDGVSIGNRGLADFRKVSAALLQDDQLLAGSIAENVAFFDPEIILSRVVEVVQRVALHSEIMAMPMGYETLIGEMGSALSGGQRQRLLLARALYRQPTFLFVDEGTANLDPELAGQVQQVIRELDATRLVVTHDPVFAHQAHRCFELRQGQLLPSDVGSVGAPHSACVLQPTPASDNDF